MMNDHGAWKVIAVIDGDGTLVESWDDATRTYTDHRTGQTRPYTAEENAAADQRAADEARQATELTLRTDTSADLAKIQQAITDLQTLLGDNTVTGSIRSWRSGVSNQYSAASMRALADLVITDAQATRRIARQTLRLAKLLVGDLGSADVGPE